MRKLKEILNIGIFAAIILILIPTTAKANVNDVLQNSFKIHNIDNGFGSGFVSNKLKGYIITNRHVVEGGKYFKVQNNEGILKNATLEYVSAKYDLAILKVKDSKYTGIKHCENSNVFITDSVYNFGNPQGIDFIFTDGYISGSKRVIHYGDYKFNYKLLTHNEINTQGQSGSALLNSSNGCVLGVMSAMTFQSSTGYSIPVEILEDMIIEFKVGTNNILDLSTINGNHKTIIKTGDITFFDKENNTLYIAREKINYKFTLTSVLVLILLVLYRQRKKNEKLKTNTKSTTRK